MTTPEAIIRADVLATNAYHVPPAAGMIKLDAMENPYRLPEQLRRELAQIVHDAAVNRYPDSAALELKARLRSVMGIAEGFDILLGNGSDEIIQLVILAAARPGAVIMAPEPTFVVYGMAARAAQLRYVGVPLRPDFGLDTERLLAAVEEHKPAVLFMASPNNPSANLFPHAALERVVAAAPGLVIVDEAYHVFASGSFMGELKRYPNLLIMRTLSKLGRAGLRLGYLVGRPEWTHEFDKLRLPYNVGVLTQLVAECALAHYEVLRDQAVAICSERSRLERELGQLLGVAVYPSEANFILVRVPDAPRTFQGLKQRNVLVKNVHGSHALLENCLRITVGTPAENQSLIDALSSTLAEN
ncbi:MAG: histidinol-phosphate transaminase [Rhodocyclaceae bacterium]|nr:histidinol-phosphate transaminase [Rhodocyclaceae bacterium]